MEISQPGAILSLNPTQDEFVNTNQSDHHPIAAYFLAFLLIGLQADHACCHVSEGVAGANAVATQLLSGVQRAHGAAGRSIARHTWWLGSPLSHVVDGTGGLRAGQCAGLCIDRMRDEAATSQPFKLQRGHPPLQH